MCRTSRPATSPDTDAALLPGSRKVEGKAVNDADAKHADVAVSSVAGTGSGAMEEPAAGGDAAPAEAAARIDAEEEAQSAEDATDTATWETSKGRGIHAHLLLSSDATGGAAPFGTREKGAKGCSGREMVTRYGKPFDPVDIDERWVRPRLATLAARRRCALTTHRGVGSSEHSAAPKPRRPGLNELFLFCDLFDLFLEVDGGEHGQCLAVAPQADHFQPPLNGDILAVYGLTSVGQKTPFSGRDLR